MIEENGLVCAYRFSADGSALQLDWADLEQSDNRGSGWTWVHLDRTGAKTRDWLSSQGGICRNIVDALLSKESRPRCTTNDAGTLLVLRGVNHNAHADPEDMVALRVWIEGSRIITVRRRKLMAIDDLRSACEAGNAPKTQQDFLIELLWALTTHMGDILDDLGTEIDALEDEQDTGELRNLAQRLIAVRHRVIPLRRYFLPQRDALSEMYANDAVGLNDVQRRRLHEITDRVTRFIEDLEASRERTAVIHDSITSRNADRMNQTMLVLTIAAAIFLPLGFLTGLLGVNVGGIPGAQDGYGFWVFTAILMAVGAAELAALRWMKWI